MTDRAHIVTALHAVRGVDMAVFTYAEHGKAHDLDAAYDSARRLFHALRSERRRINTTKAKVSRS